MHGRDSVSASPHLAPSAVLAAGLESRSKQVEALVTLPTPARPSALYAWADQHRLHVGWQHGDGWATVGGAAPAMAKVAAAIAVTIRTVAMKPISSEISTFPPRLRIIVFEGPCRKPELDTGHVARRLCSLSPRAGRGLG